jgi:diguanylate cyclase (GGDEF)-like protein
MASRTNETATLQAARDALADGRIDEASRLAEAAFATLPDGSDARAEAGYLLCMAHYRVGRWAAVLDCGEQALPLLEAPEQIARRVEVRRWMTLAACETGRFDLGLYSANDSCRLAEAAGDRAQLALSLVALGICIERIGDPWQAHRLMEEARTLVQGEEDPYTQCVILNNLCAAYIGAFYLLRDGGSPGEVTAVLRSAEAHAREAMPLVARVPGNPFFAAILEGNLAEALLHLGHTAEAEQLLATALRRVTEQGNAARSWRIRYATGELLLARGDAVQASRQLEALCAEMAGSEQANTLTRVHDALYRSWRAQGDATRALLHLERYEALERRRVVAQLQAQSRLFVTRVEAERARLEVQVERLRAAEFEADAQRDQLTGLGNRRYLDKRMPILFAAAANGGQPLTAALIDLDHFKLVNDRFGHATGDRVLVKIADLLRENTRNNDVVARLGGEEFLVLLADTGLAVAQEVCDRLRAQVQAFDWSTLAPGLAVTLSIGLSTAPPYELEALTQAADAALYRAKSGGRNRVMV